MDVDAGELLLGAGPGLCRDVLHPVRGIEYRDSLAKPSGIVILASAGRQSAMRRTCTGIIVGVVGALLLSALAAGQSAEPRSPWKYYPEDARANKGDGGPAPVRDLTGTWAGESSGAGVAGTRPSRQSAVAYAVRQAVVRPEPGGRRLVGSRLPSRTILMSNTAIRLVFRGT